MTKYARLTCTRRAQIESLHRLGYTQKEIAAQTSCHQSSISRELSRLAHECYLAGPAQQHADRRRHIPKLVPLLDRCPRLLGHLRNFMRARYSIAQSLMLITRKYPGLPTITPTAVYNWLFSTTTAVKRELRQLLIRPRVQRRPRKKTVTRQGKIPNMRPISQRPAGAEDRSEFGHWEGDLMIGVGGRSAIATLVERKTRVTLLIKVPNRTSQAVVTCVARRLQTSQAVIKSITWDQGKELTNHNELTRLTGAPVFFADAHSPWQRGSNENSNGITRRWHPKGTSFDIHPAKLRTTQQRLNNRPMPVLSGATPQETYAAEINMQ